jgi:hypothetical protein
MPNPASMQTLTPEAASQQLHGSSLPALATTFDPPGLHMLGCVVCIVKTSGPGARCCHGPLAGNVGRISGWHAHYLRYLVIIDKGQSKGFEMCIYPENLLITHSPVWMAALVVRLA